MKSEVETARRQIWVLLSVYVGAIMTGCVEVWITNAIYILSLPEAEIKFSASQWTWIASITQLGRMLFAIPAGIFADRFPKRILLLLVGILNIFTWIMTLAHVLFPVLLAARFLTGISLAMIQSMSLPLIGEIASPQFRGRLASSFQACTYFGYLLATIISVLFPSYNLQCFFNIVFSLLYISTTFTLLESPNHLLKISNYEKAKKNLEHIRPTSTRDEIEREFQSIRMYIEEENRKDKDRIHWLQFFTTQSVLVTVLINFFAFLMGPNVIIIYITIIIPENELIPRKYCPLASVLLAFLTICFSSAIFDTFPRRLMYMFGAAFGCVLLISASLSYFLYMYHDVKLCLWIFICANLVFRMHFGGVILPANCAVRSEVFPSNLNEISNSLCTMVQSAANIGAYKVYEFISENYDLQYMYVVFALNGIIVFFLVFYFLPEGRGKTLIEIQTSHTYSNKEPSVPKY